MLSHVTGRWVKVLAAALAQSLAPGREGLPGPHHDPKPARNGVGEAGRFIHYVPWEHRKGKQKGGGRRSIISSQRFCTDRSVVFARAQKRELSVQHLLGSACHQRRVAHPDTSHVGMPGAREVSTPDQRSRTCFRPGNPTRVWEESTATRRVITSSRQLPPGSSSRPG